MFKSILGAMVVDYRPWGHEVIVLQVATGVKGIYNTAPKLLSALTEN